MMVIPSIPPITNYIKDFPSVAFHFGLFIPKGIPAEAKEAISRAFKAAADSKALKDMAAEKASVAVSISGPEADKIMENAASLFGWLLYETEVTKVNPEKLGIPKK